MINKIYRTSELNFDKINFSDIKENNDKTFKFINLSISNNFDKIAIQTPQILNQSGLLINNDGKFYLELKTNFKNNEFNEFITLLDKHIIKNVLKKKYDLSWEDNLLSYSNKYIYSIKNNNTSNSFLTKLPQNFDNSWGFEIYNSKKELITGNNFIKNEVYKTILICNGIWFKDNNFGLIWSIGQMLILSKK